MARYECDRCKQEYHVVGGFVDGTDETTHLCKDLRKRQERTERRVKAVQDILEAGSLEHRDIRIVSEIIVKTLMNMNLHTDD